MTPKTQLTPVRVSAISETFVAPSRVAQDEILRALAELDPPGARPGKNLTVRVSGKQFIMARKQLLPNPFARSLFGVVNETKSGSIVDYSFSVNPAVRILFSLWFALMTVVLITGISAIMTIGVSGYRVELVVLAVSFLGGALGLVTLCLLLSQNSEREMERTLFGIINDTTRQD